MNVSDSSRFLNVKDICGRVGLFSKGSPDLSTGDEYCNSENICLNQCWGKEFHYKDVGCDKTDHCEYYSYAYKFVVFMYIFLLKLNYSLDVINRSTDV